VPADIDLEHEIVCSALKNDSCNADKLNYATHLANLDPFSEAKCKITIRAGDFMVENYNYETQKVNFGKIKRRASYLLLELSMRRN